MIDIALILFLGVGAGLLARRVGLPAAVAQLLIGVIFGPPFSHHVLVALMLVVIAAALLGAMLMAPVVRILVQQNI